MAERYIFFVILKYYAFIAKALFVNGSTCYPEKVLYFLYYTFVGVYADLPYLINIHIKPNNLLDFLLVILQ